jgi:hypothetical protein
MPDKKCLYKERMEFADSVVSIDKINRNRVCAVGAEAEVKYLEKYRKSLPIRFLSLYNDFVVQGHFPLYFLFW